MKRKQSNLRNQERNWRQKVSRIRRQSSQARRRYYRRGPVARMRHG